MVSAISGSSAFSAISTRSAPPSAAKMLEQAFSKLDVNADGGIDKNELSSFLNYVSSATGNTTQTEDSSSLFDTLDADRDGVVSKQEFNDGAKAFFDALRTQLLLSATVETANDDQRAQDILSRDDTDGDGQISDDEFKAALSQRPPQPEDAGSGEDPRNTFSLIASLIAQYRATELSNTGAATGSQLNTIA